MNTLAKIGKTMVDPWVRLARAAGALAGGYINLWSRRIPNAILEGCEDLEEKGEALCYGKKAPWTIAPGMMLRKAARMARFGGTSTRDVYSALTAVFLAAASALAVMQGAPLLVLAAVAGFPPALTAMTVAGTAVMMAGGAALAALPALCSIETGFRRRQETLDQEERERNDREWEARKMLPPLDRELYAVLGAAASAPPHERVEWLEALKAGFAADFAAAATPDGDEVSPVLQNAVRLGSPLRLKCAAPPPPKRGFWGALRLKAGR